MMIQQTVEIPADRRVYFEFLVPRDIPVGTAKVELTVTSESQAGKQAAKEWVNPLLGLCEGSSFTVEKLLEMRHKDRLLEDAIDERLWGENGE
jgi:hypothetical protein